MNVMCWCRISQEQASGRVDARSDVESDDDHDDDADYTVFECRGPGATVSHDTIRYDTIR